MDDLLRRKTAQMILRHDQFLRRIARMLAAMERGDDLPSDAEFHENELKSLDQNAADLVLELSGSLPNEIDWMGPLRFAFINGYMKPGASTWLRSLEQGLQLSSRYFQSYLDLPPQDEIDRSLTINNFINGDYKMSSENYHINNSGQIGAVGRNSNASGNKFSQPLSGAIPGVDLATLAVELEELRRQLRNEAREIEQDHAVSSIGAAESAAKKNDSAAVIRHLKEAGQWSLDVATKIGTTVAAKMIENSMHM